MHVCCIPSRHLRSPWCDASGSTLSIQVIRLIRPLRCYEWCNCCYRQELEVQSPPGTTIGWVKQDLSWWNTWMSVQDASGQTVLKIKGPCCTCDWCATEFQVTLFIILVSFPASTYPCVHVHWNCFLVVQRISQGFI